VANWIPSTETPVPPQTLCPIACKEGCVGKVMLKGWTVQPGKPAPSDTYL
jgi:hypothetical protein